MKATVDALGDAKTYGCSYLGSHHAPVFGACVLCELFRIGIHRNCNLGLAMKKGHANA